MTDKIYLSANQLLEDSYQLAANILASNFIPNYIVGVWRGGTPVAIAIQELLHYQGIVTDHIAIRTKSYTGIGERSNDIEITGLEYLTKRLSSDDKLLIVDDVFDTGLSAMAVIAELEKLCGKNCPQIRLATPYFKPSNNQTNKKPDYYLHETEQWLVFPHELVGLSKEEIIYNKTNGHFFKTFFE